MKSKKTQSRIKQEDMPELSPDIFFIRMREKRVELGLSQAKIAEIIGGDRVLYTRTENGSFPASPDRIRAIADALNVSLDWLFGRE